MPRGDNPSRAVLLNALPPALHAEATDDGAKVIHNGRVLRLRSVWAGQGFPSDIRRILERGDEESFARAVVTARRMSPGAIDLLADRGISWADADGQADIAMPEGLYIARLKPRPLPRNKTTLLTWSPSADVIAEYILSRRVQSPAGQVDFWNGVDRVAQIAHATGISAGQVAKVLVTFDEAGYTAKFGPERGPSSTRELRGKSSLLSDWAGHYKRGTGRRQKAELHVLSRDPTGLE
ncbi:hypothetical protein L2X99_10460 [Microbacterium sp. KUDC0406]|uniref:hypothetical protein n=1 Tax=Microbacterium sp. KUDC0406 TaxID=2909588 RepID=UPI001F199504|nr:hypothetical protein [Microbacterium sp. KUDC0406]UJP08906.1 hypothetical protein L2X99_10460 [Microbacterium sp. KUDC0406]